MWMFPIAIAAETHSCSSLPKRIPPVRFRLAELFTQAGVPDGVFNVVNGDKIAVDALLAHPHVKAVSFVGSTPVARARASAAPSSTASAFKPWAAQRITPS